MEKQCCKVGYSHEAMTERECVQIFMSSRIKKHATTLIRQQLYGIIN